ncbi:hypothetical protein FOMPIDRAFT_1018811 [Fomitopsis schrenkii]|uniref:Uncharacterized protein n=1 Tax=Fomitopsis schrenkii TaxID=2126942 RepID=S8DT51_FOMSC|nr:hypothetical protein FOMPIDRAFT_1018811 [Fomitopsis schrenkii]
MSDKRMTRSKAAEQGSPGAQKTRASKTGNTNRNMLAKKAQGSSSRTKKIGQRKKQMEKDTRTSSSMSSQQVNSVKGRKSKPQNVSRPNSIAEGARTSATTAKQTGSKASGTRMLDASEEEHNDDDEGDAGKERDNSEDKEERNEGNENEEGGKEQDEEGSEEQDEEGEVD